MFTYVLDHSFVHLLTLLCMLHLLHAAEEKEPYESMARADQKRYKEAMAGYKSGPTSIDSGNESDSK